MISAALLEAHAAAALTIAAVRRVSRFMVSSPRSNCAMRGDAPPVANHPARAWPTDDPPARLDTGARAAGATSPRTSCAAFLPAMKA